MYTCFSEKSCRALDGSHKLFGCGIDLHICPQPNTSNDFFWLFLAKQYLAFTGLTCTDWLDFCCALSYFCRLALLLDVVFLVHTRAMSPPSCPSQESQDSMCDTEFSASTSDCDWETDDEEELEEETPLSPVDYEEKSKTLTRLLDRMEQLLESLASQTLNQRVSCACN